MYPENLIVSTKLTPPRPQKYTLPRPRLTQRLLDALNHRLTIIQAGTGYGKSTALAALVEEDTPIIWYQLDAKDTDPQLFLLYLLHGFARQFPPFSQMPIALLEEVGKNPASLGWTAVVDSLINEITAVLKQPAILILDDVHQLDNASETIRILDRFISQAPPDLHIILSSRYPLTLPSLVTWRVKGNALEIGQNELAFTPPEIDNLFRNQYGYALTLEQASLLVSRIEGWPIALHLIWQQLQRDGGASLPDALGQLSGSAGDLLTYLTQEVLAQQPEDVQQFLRVTAVLREMTAVNCDMIRNAHDSQIILDYLLEKGLFIVNLGNGHMRYHHLFRTLLCNKLSTPEAQAIHARAAQTYQKQGEIEEAIVHLLAAQAFAEAANLLDLFGRQMVRTGRLNSLADWLRALPPDVLAQHPPLFVYMGDVARLHSRFDEALNWYQQAEQQSRRAGNIKGLGQSLRGQARLYLDTVNPTQAERLLQEALRLADGQDDRESRARLLELLAENLLNQGRAKAAAEYQTQARALREEGPGPAELPLRMLLRTGRLDQARQLLEAQVEKEKQAPVLRPRAHRETLLLLSLVLAFQGEQEAAYETAVAGRQRGEALDSQFITAVGLMRQGHAWLLLKNNNGYKEAAHCFEEAIKLSESLEVPRLKVEAYWGLCQVYGFGGDLTTAAKIAQQGIDIAHQAGDEWIVAGIQLVLGAGHTLEASYSQATRLLSQASSGFHECGDTFGEAMSRLWQCLVWYRSGDSTRLRRDIADSLQLIQTHGYSFIFQRPVLLGPPDPRALVPLLIFARDHHSQTVYAEQMLSELGLSAVETHPGYQLRVQTLGQFRLWHGREELSGKVWKRKKARQLFQFLLTHRGQMVHRDQIIELLWPDLPPDGAVRDFKIAFSGMCNVLEPERTRNAPSAYIARDGSRYGLRPTADLWLDTAEFEATIHEGNRLYVADPQAVRPYYEQALSLYEGDFLQAYPYEVWSDEERNRLRLLFLRTAERVAQTCMAQKAWEETIAICHDILAADDCWETAYQMMMTAYHQMGNRTQALRTYQQCVTALQAGLGVEPTAVTTHLYQNLTEPA